MSHNVPAHGEVVNFGTDYFLLKIKILRNANLNLPQNSQLLETAVATRFYSLNSCLIISIIMFFSSVGQLV